MTTFRGLLHAKDKEIERLGEIIEQLTMKNSSKDKEMFNKCLRGSFLKEI